MDESGNQSIIQSISELKVMAEGSSGSGGGSSSCGHCTQGYVSHSVLG